MRLHGQNLIYLRDLLFELVGREIKLKYRRSVLGFTWALLNPLLQLLVLSLVFRHILPLNIDHYVPFLFCGLLAWSWFQASLFTATGSIVDNRELVRRPGFPAEILPVATVTTNFIHYLLALPVLLFFLVIYQIPLTAALLFLPVLFALQFILTVGLAYFLARIHVTFRDTQYLLGIALMLGFYLSPVFYPASSISEKYQTVYHLNPMTVLIESYRTVIMEGRLPAAAPILTISAGVLVLLWAGYRVFKKASYRFNEEL